MQNMFYGNPVIHWIVAGAIFAGVLGGLSIARIVLLRNIRPRTTMRAFSLVAIRHTRYFFLAVVALFAASVAVTLPTGTPHLLRIAVGVVVVLQVAWWVHGIINFSARRISRRRAQTNLGSVTTVRALGILAKAILWMIFVVAVMATVGIDVTAVVAGLGIGGIAIALAVQNIVGDLFASVSIILDKPFIVGDFIKVGEQLGTVEEIGIKTTRLRSLTGEQLVFGNGDLLSSRIQNFKRMTERRVMFTIGVEYGTSPELVEAIPGIIRGSIEQSSSTRVDRIHFKEYGDSSLVYEAVYYVLSPEYNRYMDIQQAVNVDLYRKFSDAGISFAFPTTTVFLRQSQSHVGGAAASAFESFSS